ncbi:hypothetical protein [Methanobrevibacter sp.]|uniref:hypothetical protein n=1 Tax=Methanobrevibacter sp. TaxID=66852 RepID=UPI00388E05D9
MENKNIIIILLIVIAVLVVAIGVMFLSPFDSKEDCKLVITANKTLHPGDEVAIKLTDLNKIPIPDEAVNVVVTDKNGSVILNESVITTSEGEVSVVMDVGAGEYTVNATFSGNDNFTSNATSKNIKVEEEVVEQQVVQQSSESSSSSGGLHYDEEVNVYYNDDGIIVDPDGEHPQEVGNSYSKVRELRDKWERGEPVMV